MTKKNVKNAKNDEKRKKPHWAANLQIWVEFVIFERKNGADTPKTPRKLPHKSPGGARRFPGGPRRFPGGYSDVPPEVPRKSPEVLGVAGGPRRSRIFERFFGGSLASPDSLQIFRNSSEAPGNFQKTELADENAPA